MNSIKDLIHMILICLLEIQVKGLEIGDIFQSLGEVYEGLRCQID